jgi:hypothetical protein
MKSNNNNNKFSSPKIFSKKYSNNSSNTSPNNPPNTFSFNTFSFNTFSSNNSSNNPPNTFSSNTSSNNPPNIFSSNNSSNTPPNIFSSNTSSNNISSNNISSNNLNKNKIIENVDAKDNNVKLPPIKPFPTPNQQNLPVYIPTPSQKVEVKTDIFEAIKTGFFISIGQRVFDGIFGNREVKVESENKSKCLELKEMYEKCIKEDNNNCKEFYEKMKEYRCKL